MSLLMWECGLKHVLRPTAEKAFKSLLMWECGLKLLGRDPKRAEIQVTPYVGVWIETSFSGAVTSAVAGHSLCGSVD